MIVANYRKIYKDHYGIEFSKEYAVHHIDGDRENNDINNLILLPSKLHSKYHFYKNIIDGWDKDTSLSGLYPNTYLLDAIRKFADACDECYYYYRMKHQMEMGVSPKYFGFDVKVGE